MFRSKLFKTSIEPRCAYCTRGAQLEEERILCPKRGMVSAGDSCGLFRYDPLKRVPPKPTALPADHMSEEEFRL